MNKVEIADCCVDEGLKGCRADTLDDARPEHALVVLVDGASPGAAGDENANANDKCVALAPDAA